MQLRVKISLAHPDLEVVLLMDCAAVFHLPNFSPNAVAFLFCVPLMFGS